MSAGSFPLLVGPHRGQQLPNRRCRSVEAKYQSFH